VPVKPRLAAVVAVVAVVARSTPAVTLADAGRAGRLRVAAPAAAAGSSGSAKLLWNGGRIHEAAGAAAMVPTALAPRSDPGAAELALDGLMLRPRDALPLEAQPVSGAAR
jgi:hypothetical protein